MAAMIQIEARKKPIMMWAIWFDCQEYAAEKGVTSSDPKASEMDLPKSVSRFM